MSAHVSDPKPKLIKLPDNVIRGGAVGRQENPLIPALQARFPHTVAHLQQDF
jgi:hypothetical protein